MFNNNIFCAEKKNILLKKIINKNIGFSLASIFSFTVLKGIFYIHLERGSRADHATTS